VLRHGVPRFDRFTIVDGLTPYVDPTGAHSQSVISVAGGAENEVYAGYQGRFGGQEDDDPPYMVTSGDADRVELRAGGIRVWHIDISSPPGMYDDPEVVNGRDKIRTVWRILRDPASGDVWFSSNHGVALRLASTGFVFEHQHAGINVCTPDGRCSLLLGDLFGLALDPAGDLWMGGSIRLAKLQCSRPPDFWAPISPVLDVWPDASETNRTDDFVQDLAMIGSTLWVGSIPNGLASVDPDGGVHPLGLHGYESRITALEGDPDDGSLWIGLQWGGVLRLSGSAVTLYGEPIFGRELIDQDVWDIQSDRRGPGGRRRILVAFRAGAVGIYIGR